MSQSAIFDALRIAADFYPHDTELGPVCDERLWDQAMAEVEQLGAWDFATWKKPRAAMSLGVLDDVLRSYYSAEGITQIAGTPNPSLSGLRVFTDPNCPPNRMYLGQDFGYLAERMAKVVGEQRQVFMHPRTYAELMKLEQEREARRRVEARVGLRESLYRALGLGTFFQDAVA